MVVSIGIYVGCATPDAALASGGELSVMAAIAHGKDLRAIVDAATDRLGRPADHLAISYPAWWDSLRVDRLLRDVRAAGVTVDRYLTSGEAAVRWWRHLHPVEAQRAGTFLVHEVGVVSGLTLVQTYGPTIETVVAREAAAEAPPLTEVADLIAALVVGRGGPDGEHAVVFGTALAATL